MNSPVFKSGQLVRQRLVIIKPIRRCTVHRFRFMCCLFPHRCQRHFTGRYLTMRLTDAKDLQMTCEEGELESD